MLTSPLLKLVGNFFSFLVVSLIFGNALFIYLGLIPLMAAVITLLFDSPSVTVERRKERMNVWVNNDVSVTATVRADKGIGIVTAADTVPNHFELVDGSNFAVFWKGFGSASKDLHYAARCTKRGLYAIGPLKSEARHVAGFRQTDVVRDETPVELVVRPRPLNIRRMRDPKLFSRIPMPLSSLSKLGMVTTDFRELREYTAGDSYRHINWKATARLSNKPGQLPLVNEYEREGKKIVWIFLDGSALMGVGTSVDSAFEHAIQAVSSLTEYYLARSCHVGLYIYNNGGKKILPDSGRRQEYRILRELLQAEISSTEEPLARAVESCRGHLGGTTPLFVVITVVRKDTVQELLDGIKILNRYTTRASRQSHIFVLHVKGYGIAARGFAEESGAALLELRDQPSLEALRRARAFVIPWNPKKQALTSVMAAGVKRR